MEIDSNLIKEVKITPLLDTLRLENISDENYFSEYNKEYISNSRLGKLKTEGAESFFKGIKQEYNASFETGTLIHTMVLQGDSYELIDSVLKPSAKAGLMAEALYKPNGETK